MRKADFDNNLKAVLDKKQPLRPTLFEFAISDEAEEALTGYKVDPADYPAVMRRRIKAFHKAGYDHVPIWGGFAFMRGGRPAKDSCSLYDGGLITCRESFARYKWNEPEDYSLDILRILGDELPDGMKFMVFSADGVLENTIALTGYENLCYMLADDRELAAGIFSNVGERLARYYNYCAEYESVGLIFANDDWGFKSGTMISHKDLKEFVYPHYRRIVENARGKGKKSALHSCGNFDGIYEDLYGTLGFDGKHSNEDVIFPVEAAYKEYGKKIAVLGGIDVDFLCRAGTGEIEERCKKMLKESESGGAYALGSGNSIAWYVPLKNYFTMLKCANPSFKL